MRKTAILLTILPLTAIAQAGRLWEDVQYTASSVATVSHGDKQPFWFSNNEYGLSSCKDNYGYIRGTLARDVCADSLRKWKVGYGADVVFSYGMKNHVLAQQLYADIQWKCLRLSIGQKQRPSELKNNLLSTGGMTLGTNARPIPQVRLEVPDFMSFRRTKGWLSMKGHLAYGWYTDGKWQRDYNGGNQLFPYTKRSLFHSKAGFVRLGNTDKFPLTVIGGLEMGCQFGGEVWNMKDRTDSNNTNFHSHQKIDSGIKSYFHALIPGGSDANDGNYANVMGNHLGSWHMRADWKATTWKASFYMEHYFEDHSQMFLQYGWKDMLYGIEATLPNNPFLKTFLYEHIGTMDQSGPVYHDETPNMPEQISGADSYYDHHVYGAWQHAGYSMGNPLLISPIYNSHMIAVRHNRIAAHHIGLCGEPCAQVSWRVLYTHEKSLGTYGNPTINPLYADYLLLEMSYHPARINGLNITAKYGMNHGGIIGNANGGMLTVSYSGAINKKKHK